jgi:hypothetical protein
MVNRWLDDTTCIGFYETRKPVTQDSKSCFHPPFVGSPLGPWLVGLIGCCPQQNRNKEVEDGRKEE